VERAAAAAALAPAFRCSSIKEKIVPLPAPHRNPSARRGSVIVEFTLILPVLVSVFLGVVFFGQDLFLYNELEERVRAASRFASIQSYDSLNSLDPPLSCASCMVVLDPAQSQFARRVRDFLLYGTPSPGASPQLLTEGLTGANVKVSMQVLNNFPVGVRVGIVNYGMLTPAGNVTLTDKPQTQFPYFGRVAVP
jgi:TadE-like protein